MKHVNNSSVGAYEAKSTLSHLLDLVEGGRTITITRHARKVAKLVPATDPALKPELFARIRAMRNRLSLNEGESTKDLIVEGRRI